MEGDASGALRTAWARSVTAVLGWPQHRVLGTGFNLIGAFIRGIGTPNFSSPDVELLVLEKGGEDLQVEPGRGLAEFRRWVAEHLKLAAPADF